MGLGPLSVFAERGRVFEEDEGTGVGAAVAVTVTVGVTAAVTVAADIGGAGVRGGDAEGSNVTTVTGAEALAAAVIVVEVGVLNALNACAASSADPDVRIATQRRSAPSTKTIAPTPSRTARIIGSRVGCGGASGTVEGGSDDTGDGLMPRGTSSWRSKAVPPLVDRTFWRAKVSPGELALVAFDRGQTGTSTGT